MYQAMNEATWGATYDARISTQTKDSPVKLIYQARITQYTGEVGNTILIYLFRPLILHGHVRTGLIFLSFSKPIHRLSMSACRYLVFNSLT